MKAKEFMQRVKHAEEEMRRLQAVRDHYVEMGTNTAAHWGPVSGSHDATSRVERSVIGKSDALDALDDKIRDYKALVSKALELIEKIPQQKFRDVLTYYYLGGKELRQISDMMCYKDPNSIYRTHGWALSALDEVMKNANT